MACCGSYRPEKNNNLQADKLSPVHPAVVQQIPGLTLAGIECRQRVCAITSPSRYVPWRMAISPNRQPARQTRPRPVAHASGHRHHNLLSPYCSGAYSTPPCCVPVRFTRLRQRQPVINNKSVQCSGLIVIPDVCIVRAGRQNGFWLSLQRDKAHMALFGNGARSSYFRFSCCFPCRPSVIFAGFQSLMVRCHGMGDSPEAVSVAGFSCTVGNKRHGVGRWPWMFWRMVMLAAISVFSLSSHSTRLFDNVAPSSSPCGFSFPRCSGIATA